MGAGFRPAGFVCVSGDGDTLKTSGGRTASSIVIAMAKHAPLRVMNHAQLCGGLAVCPPRAIFYFFASCFTAEANAERNMGFICSEASIYVMHFDTELCWRRPRFCRGRQLKLRNWIEFDWPWSISFCDSC